MHQAAQLELKQIAEAHGFRAIVEKQLPGSQETVDLYIERGAHVIACEISITNTLEYEARNVFKCLKAGFSMVAVIAIDAPKLAKLESGIGAALRKEDSAKVRFFTKAAFVDFIQSLVIEETPDKESALKRHKGWKVRTVKVNTTEADAKQREAGIAAALAASIKPQRSQRKRGT
jgi:hypothetical protein